MDTENTANTETKICVYCRHSIASHTQENYGCTEMRGKFDCACPYPEGRSY